MCTGPDSVGCLFSGRKVTGRRSETHDKLWREGPSSETEMSVERWLEVVRVLAKRLLLAWIVRERTRASRTVIRSAASCAG